MAPCDLATAHIVPGGKRGVDWQKSTSPRGFFLAEVISAVYKTMRRGNEKMALAWALEMVQSGEEAVEFLWENILVFAIEDIGLADSGALGVGLNSRTLFYLLPRGDSRRLAVLAFVICHFSRAAKTRYSNELLLVLQHDLAEQELVLEVPDYAIDLHTSRGRDMRRGLLHYLEEGAHLEAEDSKFSRAYRDKLIRMAQEEK